MSSILPINEDDLQRAVEKVGTLTLEKLDLNKITINPLECDVSMLPHLALDFDVSIVGLEESEARTYLQHAREIKYYIGSPWAVKKAAASIFGENIQVQTWDKHEGVPGTYKFLIDVTPSKSVNDENINKTINLVDEAKRESMHLSGITMNMKNSGLYKKSLTTLSSEVGMVMPKVLDDIYSGFIQNIGTTFYMIETVVIQPQGEV